MVPLDAGVAEAWVRADSGSRGDGASPGGLSETGHSVREQGGRKRGI